MYLIPSNISDVETKVEHIKRYYGNDLPNADGLIQRIKLWKQFWKQRKSRKNENTLSNTGTFNALKNIYQMFPNNS